MKKTAFLLFACIFFLSCNKEKGFDCLKSEGAITTEQRLVAKFLKIQLLDDIELIFVPDTVQKIFVEAGSNLLPKIKTTVIGDSLILENRNYCNWVRSFKNKVKVYIHGNPGIKLYNNGFGEIKGKIAGNYFLIKSWSSENIDLELVGLDYLWLETFKLGNTHLSGKAKQIMAFRHETGRIDMRDMEYCKDLLFHDHGQGTSYIRADSALTVRIYSTGNVICSTQPQHILYERKGKGQLTFK